MAWWTAGYRSARSTPEKLPGRFIAYLRPGRFRGLAHELPGLSQSHAG